MSTISRPLASMRRMISPTSLRCTPSPLTNTSDCSIHLSLSKDGLAAALVGAAVRAQKDAVRELALQHGQLQLAFAGLFEVLRWAYDEVDQGADVGEDEGDKPPQHAHGPPPGGIGVGPVDERYP